MFTKSIKLSASLLIILTCAGCLKSPIQRPKNLKPLTKETAHDSQTKEQVTVYAKKLDANDQIEMFGDHGGQQLQKYHVVPIQLTIENKSTTAWILADKNIALNKLAIDKVNAKLFASTRWIPLWIFLGGVACAVICGPLIGCLAAHAGADIVMSLVGAASITICVAGGIFLATTWVATVDAVSNHMSHKQMHEYLETYCNAEGITINDNMNASMLFFVEESQLPEKLNLLLADKDLEKHALPFELAI